MRSKYEQSDKSGSIDAQVTVVRRASNWSQIQCPDYLGQAIPAVSGQSTCVFAIYDMLFSPHWCMGSGTAPQP